jgi:hypothetical protein
MSGGESETKKHAIYLTTNMLSPAKQTINEIPVECANEDQISDSLKRYYAALGKDIKHFKVFDPKERLTPYKNKVLPSTLLSEAEVKQAANYAFELD